MKVILDNGIVSLTHREADLVLRLSRSPPTQLVGRRISPLGICVHGSCQYLKDRPRPLDPRLERIGPIVAFGLALWLLTHKDLRRTARVRALLRYLGDALTAERSRFMGAEAP